MVRAREAGCEWGKAIMVWQMGMIVAVIMQRGFRVGPCSQLRAT